MTLLTDTERAALLDNARTSLDLSNAKGSRATVMFPDDRRPGHGEWVERIDHQPVVRMFSPDTGDWWLLTEMDPADENWVYGLTETGNLGIYKLGYIVDRFQLVRDRHFKPTKPISEYAAKARSKNMRTNEEDAAVCERMGSVFNRAICDYITNENFGPAGIAEAAERILSAARKEAELHGEERAYEYTWCHWSGDEDLPTEIGRLLKGLSSRLRRGLKVDGLEAIDDARFGLVCGVMTAAEEDFNFSELLRFHLLDFVDSAGLFSHAERKRFIDAATPGRFQWRAKDRPEVCFLDSLADRPMSILPGVIDGLVGREVAALCRQAQISLPSKAANEITHEAVLFVMGSLTKWAMQGVAPGN